MAFNVKEIENIVAGSAGVSPAMSAQREQLDAPDGALDRKSVV